MKKVIVNSGASDALIEIKSVEDVYHGKFVGQFPLGPDDVIDIYYQEIPERTHSQYFGISIRTDYVTNMSHAIISNGTRYINKDITGIVADNGEIIYSRYRHDYRISADKSVFIDGGSDYIRCSDPTRLIKLQVIEGDFYEISEE